MDIVFTLIPNQSINFYAMLAYSAEGYKEAKYEAVKVYLNIQCLSGK